MQRAGEFDLMHTFGEECLFELHGRGRFAVLHQVEVDRLHA